MHLSSPEPSTTHASDYAECREAIRQGSKSFYAASLILPAKVREPAYGLYAFCRLSDDAIDLGGGSPNALARLRDRLERIHEGRPLPVAADRAMADLMRRYAIPREAPEALLEGLAWDADGRRYEGLNELFDYAARVAGTVGVMMTLLMGVRSPEALARACDLGVAMQLTNIARDVGEDARNGRIYLPLQWLREVGIDPEDFLADPVIDDRLKSVIARLLAVADNLYERSRAGVAHLPLACRPAILAAGMIYAEIGRALERLSLDSISHRAHVPRARKARLLAMATASVPLLSRGWSVDALPCVDFLIEAVARTPAPDEAASAARARPMLNFRPRFIRVLEIFERLERAEQPGR